MHSVEDPDSALDSDLLAEWAGEEFVAAGRADRKRRDVHRKRAVYLSNALMKQRRPKKGADQTD